jgi:uncharacterized surface protein with fasciclin (FAS1) repeats
METSQSKHLPPSRNIVETVIAAGPFNTLASCIQAAGLNATLSAKGPMTIFAPTDAAFKKLVPGALEALLKDTKKLKAILSYHVIAGFVASRDVKAGEVMTMQGSTLTAVVTPSGVQVNDAHLTQPGIAATNGVVHVIDAVLVPKHWQLQAVAA